MAARKNASDVSLRDQRILLTGGGGFLGSHVAEQLRGAGAGEIIVPRRSDYDLVQRQACHRLLADTRPDLVLHLAGRVGGIGANVDSPGTLFFENLMMGAQLLEECRIHKVKKVLTAGSVCSYPKHIPVPFREEDLWNGYPEATNAPYGLAKKMLLVQGQAYRQQYGMNIVHVLLVNMYGPRDNFDPATSHVIPALIRKFHEAIDSGRECVEAWGTGRSSREFLYVEDAARGICLAAAGYEGREPVNLGTGSEITIRDLTERLGRLAGFTGRIRWDASKPEGQPRRCLDVSRARELFGFRAEVPLNEGLRRTVEWYKKKYAAVQTG